MRSPALLKEVNLVWMISVMFSNEQTLNSSMGNFIYEMWWWFVPALLPELRQLAIFDGTMISQFYQRILIQNVIVPKLKLRLRLNRKWVMPQDNNPKQLYLRTVKAEVHVLE